MRILPPILACLLLLSAYVFLDGAWLVGQSFGFLRIVSSARDIRTLRMRGTVDDQTLEFFDRIERIREYAREELGLQASLNFTRYATVNRAYLVDVVSAVRDDRFSRLTWDYPVVGRMFYRGYYDPARAQAEARRLERMGYDVLVRSVSAFSTLGYFSDPVYSFMAEYSEYRLANLIIHEEMHATVWITNKNVYNEEIATFIGDQGAANYIRDVYGADSYEYWSIFAERQDRDTFRAVMRELHAELSEAYNTLETRGERLSAKDEIIRATQQEFAERYDERFLTNRYRGFSSRKVNNAYVDAHIKYSGDLALYYDLHEGFDFDLSRVVNAIRESVFFPDDPRGYLERLLEATG